MRIDVSYPNQHYNYDLDQKIINIAQRFGGCLTDSGCCLFAGGTRDIGLQVPKAHAKNVQRSIRATFAALQIKGASVGLSN